MTFHLTNFASTAKRFQAPLDNYNVALLIIFKGTLSQLVYKEDSIANYWSVRLICTGVGTVLSPSNTAIQSRKKILEEKIE